MNKDTKNLLQLKGTLIELAFEVAREDGFNLDYSEESLKDVATILNNIHKSYRKTKSEEGLDGLALEFGMYIIGVLEHKFGKGELTVDDLTFGERSFPYVVKGIKCFPYIWCLKNIYEGDQDNIYFKYRALKNSLAPQ